MDEPVTSRDVASVSRHLGIQSTVAAHRYSAEEVRDSKNVQTTNTLRAARGW